MTARGVIAHGTCWRCTPPSTTPSEGKQVALVHDPMSAPTDGIGICVTCAVARDQVAASYAKRRS